MHVGGHSSSVISLRPYTYTIVRICVCEQCGHAYGDAQDLSGCVYACTAHTWYSGYTRCYAHRVNGTSRHVFTWGACWSANRRHHTQGSCANITNLTTVRRWGAVRAAEQTPEGPQGAKGSWHLWGYMRGHNDDDVIMDG